MNHIFQPSPRQHGAAELSVIAVFSRQPSQHPFLNKLSENDAAYVRDALKHFSAQWLEHEKVSLPSRHTSAVLLLGLGEKKHWNRRRMVLAARKIVTLTKQLKKKSCAVLLDDLNVAGMSVADLAMRVSQNMEMAHYAYRAYVKQPKEGWSDISTIWYFARTPHPQGLLQKSLNHGAIIGEQINMARNLANTPGGDMTPRALARFAVAEGKKYGVTVTVLGESEMRKLGMGAILGVSRGSAEEAQLIVMEYNGASKKSQPIVFVGKGITYDSGGINLKPTGALEEMHMDMSGGAAVLASIVALARLKERVHAIGLIPAAENMPSGSSYRPGDVLRALSGTTVEILNTDAEGRLVLADALTYAKNYHPSLVVDVATLTGASMIALAPHASAVFSRNEQLVSRLCEYGEQSGDYLWPLPLWEEYEDELKGTIADIKNAKMGRDARATNGALFLHHFAKDFPQWAHIDIAPTMTTVPAQMLASGSRGSGTGLLIEIARTRGLLTKS